MNAEQRNNIIERDNYTCQKCGATPGYDNLQIAHRLGNNKRAMRHIENFLELHYKKTLTKKFIQEKIIDNELDVVTTCSLECNASFNLFFRPVERDELLTKIIEEVKE